VCVGEPVYLRALLMAFGQPRLVVHSMHTMSSLAPCWRWQTRLSSPLPFRLILFPWAGQSH